MDESLPCCPLSLIRARNAQPAAVDSVTSLTRAMRAVRTYLLLYNCAHGTQSAEGPLYIQMADGPLEHHCDDP